jgi:hypothetical protein
MERSFWLRVRQLNGVHLVPRFDIWVESGYYVGVSPWCGAAR